MSKSGKDKKTAKAASVETGVHYALYQRKVNRPLVGSLHLKQNRAKVTHDLFVSSLKNIVLFLSGLMCGAYQLK